MVTVFYRIEQIQQVAWAISQFRGKSNTHVHNVLLGSYWGKRTDSRISSAKQLLELCGTNKIPCILLPREVDMSSTTAEKHVCTFVLLNVMCSSWLK